jgi:general secretion pathway protein L
MAHKILGIDLGAWSVKVTELEAGFRSSRLLGLYEKPLLEALEGESELGRRTRTAAALIAEQQLTPEMCATSMGGDATLRLITLPFSDPKKIEQVLGYELESQILGEISDLVYDSVISSTRGDQTNVIAVAMQRDRVKEIIEAMQQIGAEPRVIGAAPLSYAALRGHSFITEGQGEPLCIIDVGHRHTLVCVVRGDNVLFARAIGRGSEDVTLQIADVFKMEYPAAEAAKHEQAFLLGPGEVAESPSHRRVDEAVREGVRPLVRELRQTLAAYRAAGEPPVARILLTGGGARLRGFSEHLSRELGVAIEPLVLGDTPLLSPETPVAFPAGDGFPAQALGLALAAAQPVPQVNLRRGELAYRTDYSYLRAKAGYLAAAVLVILTFAAVNAAASLRGLRKEAEALEGRLKQETTELFGEPRLDGKAVSEELRQGPKGGVPPIPTLTAFDVLDEISRAVPAADKGKLDILELDIKPKKVYLKATAGSAQEIDDLAAALEKIECFDKVEKGKISSVTSRPSGENTANEGPKEMKQFTLTINGSCP